MNYIQCDECKYRLVCNGEPLTSGSTGSCDHRVISNTPIFPKIKNHQMKDTLTFGIGKYS